MQVVQEAAHPCDPFAETEVPGLIPGTDLRPEDVLTSALGSALTALDVSICSLHAQEAGFDHTQTTVDSKLAHYGLHLNTPHAQNIDSFPIVWSAPLHHVDRLAHSPHMHLAQV